MQRDSRSTAMSLEDRYAARTHTGLAWRSPSSVDQKGPLVPVGDWGRMSLNSRERNRAKGWSRNAIRVQTPV